MISTEILNEVVSEVVCSEEEFNNMKTPIEPTKEFLTNTAMTMAEMLDNIADQIDDICENDDDDTEDLENRLDILRGDTPRHKKVVEDSQDNTLISLPLKVNEDLRFKHRNLEELNENLSHALEELEQKYSNLEENNKELANKLKEMEEKRRRKEPKKTTSKKFIVIDMETNEEDDDIEQFVKNKETGFSRPCPQCESQKKKTET